MARDGNPICSEAVGPFLMLCLILFCISCTHALWFLHGREGLLYMWYECFYCYQFCRKMDLTYWILMSDWHLIHWRLANISLKHLHVVILQLSRNRMKSRVIFHFLTIVVIIHNKCIHHSQHIKCGASCPYRNSTEVALIMQDKAMLCWQRPHYVRN